MDDRQTYTKLVERIQELEAELDRRKGVEETVREFDEKWQFLLENIPSLITVTDRDGRIQYINRKERDSIQDPSQEPSIYDFTSPEYHGQIRDAVKQAFESGQSGKYQAMGNSGGTPL